MLRLMVRRSERTRGQSFVEMAIVLPILLLLLATLVEVGFMYFAHMTMIDLTREGARFASSRDYLAADVSNWGGVPESACEDSVLHYYYDTACFFIDPDINPYLTISPTDFADVTISVFTVNYDEATSQWVILRRPMDGDGVWSLYNDNWKKDCEGNVVLSEPAITNSEFTAMFINDAPSDKGYVLVEVWYCYEQIMGLPGISQIINDPMRMYAYTFMPAAEAMPTPTPIPP